MDMRAFPIFYIMILLCIGIGIQGSAHAQTTNNLQLLNQWSFFYGPCGVAVDSSGNVFVADYFNNAVKEILTNGTTITLDNGFNGPTGVAVDPNGNIYVTDTGNNAIKEILTNGTTITLNNEFNGPCGVAVDPNGNIYVADTGNNAIKEILTNGSIIILGDGFNGPCGVAIDSNGNVYVADTGNNAAKEIHINGSIITLGTLDNEFNGPTGVAVDPNGNIYVTDTGNNAIKEILTNGTTITLNNEFNGPCGVAVDPNGNVYAADYYNNAVKEILTNGSIITLGNGFNNPDAVAVDPNGNIYVADTRNNAVKEILTNGSIITLGNGFHNPDGVAVDSSGNVYVADAGNNAVKEILTNGSIITLVTHGHTGTSWTLHGVAVDHNDNIYAGNFVYWNGIGVTCGVVEEILTDGTIEDIWGDHQRLTGVAVDSNGNIYVSGKMNVIYGAVHDHVYYPAVYEISTNGDIITLGSGFNGPIGVAVDSDRNVYVVDSGSNAVSEILPNGEIITLGSGFNGPIGVAVDPVGDLFVVDSNSISEYAPISNPEVVPNAAYVSDTIPDTMITGQPYPVSITMQNTGTAAWTSNMRYMLAVWGQTWNFNLQNDTSVDGLPAYGIPNGVIVQPGQTYTWNITLNPQWPGSSGIGFQVVDGNTGEWLGKYGNKTITIDPADLNSSYAGDNIQDNMTSANQYMVAINFTNTGNIPWTSGNGDMLAVWGQTWNFNLQNDNNIDGLPAYSIPEGITVQPGQNYTWNIILSPQWPGTFGIGFQVVDGNTGEWPGDYDSKTITIIPPISNSSYVDDSIPDTMTATNEYMVAINFTNTGNTAWTSDKGDMLSMWGQTWNLNLANDTSVDGLPAYSIPSGITVQPGQTYTWNLTLSPQWPGSFSIGFQVVEASSDKWLGNYGSKIMTIDPAIPSSAYASGSIPDTMAATNQYAVAINFTNTGNTAWTSDKGDMLAMWGQTWNLNLANDTSIDGLPAYSIPAGITVQPGQTYTWNLTLSPQWSGNFGIGFQVVEANNGKWLGDYGSKTMIVN